MDPGRMDREIVLQTATKSQDEDGTELLTWSSETIWAQWLPGGTKEAYRAQQWLGSDVEGVFRIYDRTPRPTPDATRILFDGRIFDVGAYTEIGRGEGLELPVKAHGE